MHSSRSSFPWPFTRPSSVARVLTITGLLCSATLAQAVTTYRVIELAKALPTSSTSAYAKTGGIDAEGNVVGTIYDTSGATPVIWNMASAHSLQALQVPADATYVEANKINAAGQIMGTTNTRATIGRVPLVWSSAQQAPVRLRPTNLAAPQVFASDFNDSGAVVGTTFFGASAYVSQATLWTPDGVAHNLGTPRREVDAGAFGVNNALTVVGNSEGLPFIWTPTAGRQSLAGFPGSTYTEVRDINDIGQIVGIATLPNDPLIPHPVIFDPVAGWADMGTLENGQNYSVAHVNNSSVAIGSYRWVSDNSVHSFVWRPTEGLSDLASAIDPSDPAAQTIRQSVLVVTDVSETGSIAAYYITIDKRQNVYHPVILMPLAP